ncbi:hypothetical protein [Cellulomonas iranensis]|uniref:hypothetical protein n=1 Tax=Cellulomonas iranensis TaxID=76862 RepID=UPI0013D440E3|nr:hypothetical protein [Cellulomonas iranensis]
MNDVSARLRALAQDVAAQHEAGPGLPVDRMRAEARRRRTARATWSTGAAAAVVVAVAIGAAALPWRDARPAPAVTPTTSPSPTAAPTRTPSPTPSPTPTPAVVLPAGDPSLPFGVCGSLVGAAPAFPVDPELVLDVDDLTGTITEGGTLPFEAALTVDGGGTVVRRTAGPRLLVTHDGVVVAVADGYDGARTDWVAQPSWGAPRVYRSAVRPQVCVPGAAGPASTDVPLPPGTYEVWALDEGASFAGTTEFDEIDADAFADPAAGHRRTALAGPWALTVAPGDGTSPSPAAPVLETDAPPYPTPGGTLPPAPTTAGPWRFENSTEPLDLRVVDVTGPEVELAPSVLTVTGSLTYVGPGRTWLHAELTTFSWLVQDGRVVASDYVPTDMHTGSIDLAHGTPLPLGAARMPVASCEPSPSNDTICTGEGDGVRPGQYLLVPGVVIHGGTRWTPQDGEQAWDAVVGAQGPYVVLGTPVPLTLR